MKGYALASKDECRELHEGGNVEDRARELSAAEGTPFYAFPIECRDSTWAKANELITDGDREQAWALLLIAADVFLPKKGLGHEKTTCAKQ